jgi:hypothetical protein
MIDFYVREKRDSIKKYTSQVMYTNFSSYWLNFEKVAKISTHNNYRPMHINHILFDWNWRTTCIIESSQNSSKKKKIYRRDSWSPVYPHYMVELEGGKPVRPESRDHNLTWENEYFSPIESLQKNHSLKTLGKDNVSSFLWCSLHQKYLTYQQ